MATTYTWTTPSSGNFNASNSWSINGSSVAYASNTTSTYALIAPNGSPTITINSPESAFILDFENPTGGTNSAILQWGTTTTRTMTVGSNVIINAGTVDLQSSAVSTSKLTINGTAVTALSVGTGGTLIQQTGTITAGSGSSVATSLAGTETFSGGTFIDPGSLSVTGGTFSESATGFSVTGQADFTGGADTISAGTFNAGTLTVDGTTNTLSLSGGTTTTTVNSASNTIASGDAIAMSGAAILDYTNAGVSTSGGVTIAGTLSGAGTVKGLLAGSGGTGVVEASGGTLDLKSAIGNSTALTFEINSAASSVLEVDGTVGSGNTFKFLGSSGDLDYAGGSSLTTAISGMSVGTTKNSTTGTNFIDFANQTITLSGGNAFTSSSGTINLSNGSVLSLSNIQSPPSTWYVNTISDGSNGTDVFLDQNVCYTAGTRIRTATGDVAVEDLAPGDTVMTLAGADLVARPVQWIGHRRLDLARHKQPNLAAPIRIACGAFAENLPLRDLVVSPDHCLFTDGKLIPAKLLINDMTITQERDRQVVDYYHVELERHAVLLAEGLPAESYLDTGNRAFFSNAGLALVLHPEFHVNAGLKCWETDACAPLAVSQAAVEPVWQRLAHRAEELGYQPPNHVMTDDSQVRLVVDGRVIRPLSGAGDRYIFTLPAGVSSVRLTSRATVPSYVVPYLDDWRHLGVAIRRIVVRDSAGVTEIAPDHPGLTRGWYQVERDDATMWRWMDGDAVLPIQPTDSPAVVEVHVGMSMTHILDSVTDTEHRLAA